MCRAAIDVARQHAAIGPRRLEKARDRAPTATQIEPRFSPVVCIAQKGFEEKFGAEIESVA